VSTCAKRSLPGGGSNLDKRWGFPLKLWEKLKKEEPHLWQTLCHMNRIKARKHLVHKCYLSPLAYLPQRGMRLRENAPLAKHQRRLKKRLGRKRLAIYLTPSATYYAVMGLKGKSVYPAFWAWETQDLDTKDIRDKGSLGTKLVTHLSRHHLPRYQWTACEACTRLRFLAYSHRLDSTCGLAFLLL